MQLQRAAAEGEQGDVQLYAPKLVNSRDNSFLKLQCMDAPMLEVQVRVYDAEWCDPQDALTISSRREHLRLLATQRLYQHLAALLKWQLQWQLKAQDRELLNSLGGLSRIQLQGAGTKQASQQAVSMALSKTFMQAFAGYKL